LTARTPAPQSRPVVAGLDALQGDALLRPVGLDARAVGLARERMRQLRGAPRVRQPVDELHRRFGTRSTTARSSRW
jgi:hypothetical protein